jgi:hypothetical protein
MCREDRTDGLDWTGRRRTRRGGSPGRGLFRRESAGRGPGPFSTRGMARVT